MCHADPGHAQFAQALVDLFFILDVEMDSALIQEKDTRLQVERPLETDGQALPGPAMPNGRCKLQVARARGRARLTD
jgi:hypothetical protein